MVLFMSLKGMREFEEKKKEAAVKRIDNFRRKRVCGFIFLRNIKPS